MNFLIHEPPENVLGVILFGSHARGNNSAISDLDICLFVREASETLLRDARAGKIDFICHNSAVEISLYSSAVANKMANLGSLFLWHLRQEGDILFQRDRFIDRILDQLAKPTQLDSELDIHADVLERITLSRSRGIESNLFDLSAIHTVLRNVSILLCAKSGNYRFGRMDAFLKAVEVFDIRDITTGEYSVLLEAHLLYHRGVKPSRELPLLGARSLVDAATAFVCHARKFI